ncbi:hypothetical protein BJ973_001772 [Actinoplanes tereljensis]|uniref:Uncharacterized protein n=1 Tax=Paractinoplanes tereljensis TaxID=571912 RepID=A0A919NMI5_9ACTN|nr:hypothetical protein [Actinoplanes tereljensis]GIF20322.1 hypothetical protein Ate02nite_30520 [Actinoplanes tereljensis]
MRDARWVIAAVLGALAGVLTVTLPPDLADFAAAGDLMLHGRFADVYATPWNQAGPVQLLVARILLIGGSAGTPALPVIGLVGAALVVGAMWLCRGSLRRELFAGGLALLWVLAPLPWNGHPAEIAIPLLWAYAIGLQRNGRHLAAAASLGLGFAIAPWAILGVPGLLAAAPFGRAVRTGVLAVAFGVGSYLPFVLTGHFAMFELHWAVGAGTLWSPLISEVTWVTRLVQAVVVSGGVALIALRSRRDPRAVALVPLSVAVLRVVTDPVQFPYYWFPVAVASILLFAVDRRRPLSAGAIGYLALLAESADLTVAGSLGCLALIIVTLLKSVETRATFPSLAATR